MFLRVVDFPIPRGHLYYIKGHRIPLTFVSVQLSMRQCKGIPGGTPDQMGYKMGKVSWVLLTAGESKLNQKAQRPNPIESCACFCYVQDIYLSSSYALMIQHFRQQQLAGVPLRGRGCVDSAKGRRWTDEKQGREARRETHIISLKSIHRALFLQWTLY